jgi:hypothetical protein
MAGEVEGGVADRVDSADAEEPRRPFRVSPPLWVDEQGRPRPTRPCPQCQRGIPVNRSPVKTLPTAKRWPYQVMTFVEWCGHQQEVVLVPEGDGWYAEIPVLGVAR